MHRRLTVTFAVAAVATTALTLPSQAAVKKKPAPIKGSYTVNLVPDPTKEATSLTADGCSGLSPAAVDRHAFTVPAAGTLEVTLEGDDPAKGSAPAGFDWDLYTYDASGLLGASDGATAAEQTVDNFKKKTPVTIEVCNLDGLPDAVISYTFTYK